MDDSVLDRLATVIRATLDQPAVTIGPDTTADDVDGWDSLTHAVLLMRIERAFAIRFDPAEAMSPATVGELAALISRRLAEG